jgi:hypothetical protein
MGCLFAMLAGIAGVEGGRWGHKGVVETPSRKKAVIMEPNSNGRLVLARCGVSTEVTASQFAALSALPDPVEPITPHLACELADGHEDDHAALAVASDGGDQWWWVRWGRQRHDVVHIDPCEGTEAADGESCLLPAGHPGSHSFDLEPWPAIRPAY